MDLSIIEALGWRDAVMAVVAAASVYMLVAVLRLMQVRRRPPAAATPPAPAVPREPLQDLPQEPVLVAPPPPPSDADEDNAEAGFGNRLREQALRRELRRLGEDQAQTQADLAALRAELANLAEAVEHLKAGRHVSPLYSEAMGLAQQGLDARSIAGRCAISIGEAELVVALSRGEVPQDRVEDDHDEK